MYVFMYKYGKKTCMNIAKLLEVALVLVGLRSLNFGCIQF